MSSGCGHLKYDVIASQCAHWRGNPLWRGTAASTTDCPGNLKGIATSRGVAPLLAMTVLLIEKSPDGSSGDELFRHSPVPVWMWLIYLQAMRTHELQQFPIERKVIILTLQATHTHELQLQKCTMHDPMHGLLCAYLTFSSVLPAHNIGDLRPLSRFRDGKSPRIWCEPTAFTLITSSSHASPLR